MPVELEVAYVTTGSYDYAPSPYMKLHHLAAYKLTMLEMALLELVSVQATFTIYL